MSCCPYHASVHLSCLARLLRPTPELRSNATLYPCLANTPLNKWISPLKAQGLDASGVCASVPEVSARQAGCRERSRGCPMPLRSSQWLSLVDCWHELGAVLSAGARVCGHRSTVCLGSCSEESQPPAVKTPTAAAGTERWCSGFAAKVTALTAVGSEMLTGVCRVL